MIPQYVPSYNREEIAKQISEYVLNPNNFFSEHTKTKEFETELANFLNVKHCIAVTNCTTALSLALLANGIKAGDYVLIPNITMFSTQAAVELIGAKPIFIDINSENLCMDLEKAKQEIMSRTPFYFSTVAVIYVTLNGRKHNHLEYNKFEIFCDTYHVKLIEDNAQSFGSTWNSNGLTANFSSKINCPYENIGCFSFSFHKLLSTGQGGMCCTNNDELGIRLRELKNVGRVTGGADIHERFGYNAKFTDIQAIIGLNGLKDIQEKIVAKKWIYKLYRELLKDVQQIVWIDTNLEYTTPWFVDCFVENRNGLQDYLKSKGIGTRAIYPALNTQPINGGQILNCVAERWSSKGMWLPSSIDITAKEIQFICNTIKDYYNV